MSGTGDDGDMDGDRTEGSGILYRRRWASAYRHTYVYINIAIAA